MKKVGIIGAGNHALANIYPVLKYLQADVGAICTTRIESAQHAEEQFNFHAKLFTDIEEFLSSALFEKVIVVVPGPAAAKIENQCLLTGYETFCEKPCGMNIQEAMQVDRSQIEVSKGLQLGCMKRYAPVYQKLKNISDLGNICSFNGYFHVDASRFCATDADYFYYVGIHFLDLVRYLFGAVYDVSVRKTSGSGFGYFIFLECEKANGVLHLENRSAYTQECEGMLVTYENGYARSVNLNELIVHQANTVPDVWKNLNEKEERYFVSENPASGMMRDLYLRGFVGELKYFLDNTIEPNHDNLLVTEVIEKILTQLQ